MSQPVPWPPRDTARNRFLFWAGLLGGTAATVYFGLFAVLSDGWLPWTIFIVLLVATLLDGMGLLLMHAPRRGGDDARGATSPIPEGRRRSDPEPTPGPASPPAQRPSGAGGGRHARPPQGPTARR